MGIKWANLRIGFDSGLSTLISSHLGVGPLVARERAAAGSTRVQAFAELRTRVERAEQTECVHLSCQDCEEQVEVQRGGVGQATAVRVAEGVDDGGGEHARGGQHGGLPRDGDNVCESVVEVLEPGSRAPEGDGYYRMSEKEYVSMRDGTGHMREGRLQITVMDMARRKVPYTHCG